MYVVGYLSMECMECVFSIADGLVSLKNICKLCFARSVLLILTSCCFSTSDLLQQRRENVSTISSAVIYLTRNYSIALKGNNFIEVRYCTTVLQELQQEGVGWLLRPVWLQGDAL